jgi:hypothetical protein
MIKTKIQCEILLPVNKRRYTAMLYDGGFYRCMKDIYLKGGLKGCK